ncbi:MAG: cbb3-type cytochrome c oxidase N-terminal domain-containing protein [Chitinophagales bacterium]
MFLFQNSFKKYLAVVTALLLSAPVWAAGPPAENPLYNPLAILLICVMIILLIAIGILGSILTGASDISLMKWKKKKEEEKKSVISHAAALFIGCVLLSSAIFAQDKTVTNPAQTVSSIGGLTPSVFYVMVSIIFLELLVILVLLINVRILIRSQKEKLIATEAKEVIVKKSRLSWWGRFNKLKPIEQEADLDLGHDYDGIRELNNRLPPWWIYGFYATIVFAAIYLWRYHVSHSAPLSKEEYEIAVQKADQKIKDYLKQKGETIDENTVTMLGATDILEGKRIFQISCIACHNEGGAGNVGPNLTDDYWLHGGDIKSVFKTIKYGFNAMPTWQNSYSNKQIAQLASYVKSLHGTNPPNPKAAQGELYKEEVTTPGTPADSSAPKKDKKLAAK